MPGHASAAFTLDVYSHVLPRRKLTRSRQHFLLDSRGCGIAGQVLFVILLEAQPEFRRCAEVACQPERHQGANAAPPGHDTGNVVGWHAKSAGRLQAAPSGQRRTLAPASAG